MLPPLSVLPAFASEINRRNNIVRDRNHPTPPPAPPPPLRVLTPPPPRTLLFSIYSLACFSHAQQQTWNWQSWFFWWGSIGLFFFFISVYSLFAEWAYLFYYVAFQMMSRPTFWLVLIQVRLL